MYLILATFIKYLIDRNSEKLGDKNLSFFNCRRFHVYKIISLEYKRHLTDIYFSWVPILRIVSFVISMYVNVFYISMRLN